MLNRLEGGFRRKISKAINKRYRAAATALAKDGPLGIVNALRGHQDEIAQLLRQQYLRTAEVFGRRTLDSLKGAGTWEKKDFGDDQFNRYLREWLDSETATQISHDISKTTRLEIQRILDRGIVAGDSVETIARAMRKKLGPLKSGIRAHVIARTETHNAASFASHSAAQSAGIPGIMREWIDVDDSRTRWSHDVEGGGGPKEYKSMHESFVLTRKDGSMYSLKRPGDPDGPPDGVIMCRCAVIFHPPE